MSTIFNSDTMKTKILFISLFLFSINAIAQEKEEFEGIISYTAEIQIKDSRVNKKALEDYYGTKKNFYYKNGNYKWLTLDGILESEIYNRELDSNNTITKRVNNDTLYFHNFTTSTDQVLDIDSLDIKTICGIKCQGFKFTVTNKDNHSITRSLYFPMDTLLYPSDYYSNQKGMANGTIYSIGGAIPLQLILEIEGVPYTFTYTATKLKEKKLKDSEFLINPKAPRKSNL